MGLFDLDLDWIRLGVVLMVVLIALGAWTCMMDWGFLCG